MNHAANAIQQDELENLDGTENWNNVAAYVDSAPL